MPFTLNPFKSKSNSSAQAGQRPSRQSHSSSASEQSASLPLTLDAPERSRRASIRMSLEQAAEEDDGLADVAQYRESMSLSSAKATEGPSGSATASRRSSVHERRSSGARRVVSLPPMDDRLYVMLSELANLMVDNMDSIQSSKEAARTRSDTRRTIAFDRARPLMESYLTRCPRNFQFSGLAQDCEDLAVMLQDDPLELFDIETAAQTVELLLGVDRQDVRSLMRGSNQAQVKAALGSLLVEATAANLDNASAYFGSRLLAGAV